MYVSMNLTALVSEQPINIILPIPCEIGTCNPHFMYKETKRFDQDSESLWQKSALSYRV